MNLVGIAPTDSANYQSQAWTAFNKQAAACSQVCGTVTLANAIRKQMLADVSPPYGQYANPDSVDMNSIFAPSFGQRRYTYSNLSGYLDERGKPDTIQNVDGSFSFPQNLTEAAFISNFKPSWADLLITKHPEYCKLQLYESNPSFTSSHLWDLRFANITTYKQAKDSGFLNPLGYTDVIAQPSSIIKDPFFDNSLNPTYANIWRSVLNDSMRMKALYSGTTYLDIWSLATALAQCDSGNTACFIHYSGNLYPFDIDTSCRGTLDMAWKYFQQLYTLKKAEIINKILAQGCDSRMNINVNKHTLNFPDPALVTKTPVASTQDGNSTLTSFVNTNCQGYVAQWWKELGPCNYNSNDSMAIFPRLIKVCTEGGDLSHPFGSSTVSPSSTNSFKSFADVIKSYNDSLATAPDHRVLLPNQCNAYLISAPASYDNRPAMANEEIWRKPDSCTCSNINSLYNKYIVNGKTDADFSAFMWRTTGTQISNAVLDSLRNLCNGNITCKYLKSSLVLPPVLQCGVKDVCVNCSMVKTVYTKFQGSFPGIVPAYNNTDSLQRANNILFERFMNYNLGFGKQTNDYLDFMNSCGITGSLLPCDSLQKIKSDFLSWYKNIKDTGFADLIHFNVTAPYPITINDYQSIFKSGIAHIPTNLEKAFTGWPGSSFTKYDTLCTGNDFTIEARIKNPVSARGQWAYDTYFKFATDSVLLSLSFMQIAAPYSLTEALWYAGYTLSDKNNSNYHVVGDTGFVKNFDRWRVVKIRAISNVFNIYVDDTLIRSLNYAGKINKLYYITSGFKGTDGYLDYIKVYDKYGIPTYVEEFEDAKSSPSNYPIAFSCKQDCQTAFVNYFNLNRGTSYTSVQVDSIYNANCGFSPNICSNSFLPTNDSLQGIAQKFPCFYSYLDDATVNTQNACSDFSNWVTEGTTNGVGLATNKYADLNISNGTLKTETGHTYNNAFGWMAYFSQYNERTISPNNRYSFEVRVKNPGITGSITLGTNGTSATNTSAVTADEDFAVSLNPNPGYQWTYRMRKVNYTFNPGAVSRSFDSFRVVKYSITPANFQVFLDGALILNVPRDGVSFINSVNGFTVTSENKVETLEIDWLKLYVGDTLTMFEDFNNYPSQYFKRPDPKYVNPKLDCKTAFTNYFNYYFNLGLNTYAKIDSFYRTRGLHLIMPCANTDTSYLCGKSQPQFPSITLNQYSPCYDSTHFMVTTATLKYQAYKDSLNNTFNDKYLAKCLNAYKLESFTVTQPMSEFHYTLYYYDQAGNLVRTVPPEGVDMSVFSRSTYFDSVKTARANNTLYKPNHQFKTNYRYNSLNQVMAQATPDAGLSNFWYDRLGRLVVSENARQKAASSTEAGRQYSYTQYDYLGRISEVGQINNTLANGTVTDSVARNASLLNTWLLNLSNNKEQVTRTYYDIAYPYANAIPLNAVNLRNRVAYTTLTNNYSTTNFNQATFYSYDIHGNVDTLLQDYGASTSELTKNIMNRNSNRWERIVYKYDLISGKVNHVAYNPSYYDVTLQAKVIPVNQFFHRYSYDAENRLTTVETSRDSVIWEKDARYYYYKHGPLARMLIGDQQVQGLDYAYTLQGWLKGVNSSAAASTTDMGEDGKIGNQNINIARDLVGYSLNYYTGDYTPINSSVNPFPGTSGPLNSNYRPLYNGNISSMTVNIKPLGTPYLYNYKYDQLNRLTGMDAFTGLDTLNNNWTALTATKSYNERVSYDGNGNIKKYTRYFDVTSTPMDSLTYNYLAGTNKLGYVADASQAWVNVNKKIKNQAAGNYAYDEIGNLTQDISENIPAAGIKWNVYGKISEINHSAAGVLYSTKKINYTYDAAGNRIGKKVIKFGSPTVSYTWYVRDAAGNVMHEYTAAKDTVATDTTLSPFSLVWAESHVYGSSRLGVQNQYITAEPPFGNGATLSIYRGQKFYEISNHLGNVLAVISDKKIGHTTNGTTLDYYNPDIISATDYYPGGMVSRSANLTNLGLTYHYGFNGKENDADVKGDGNQQDYGMRIYDPRLGRFLSMDPISSDYPFYSPYQFAANKPIAAADLDGLEDWMMNQGNQVKQKALFEIDRSTRPRATLSPYNPANRTFTQRWRDSKDIVAKITYSMANGVYTLPQQLTSSVRKSDYIFNLGGNAYPAKGIWGERERVDNFISGATILIPGVGAEAKVEQILGEESNKLVIGLGKNINLETFASKTSSISMHEFEKIPGYMQAKPGFYNFEDAFKFVSQTALNSKGKLLFNLEYVNLQAAGKIKAGTGLYERLAEFGGKSLWEMNMTTEWELSKILNDKTLSSITEFMRMGQRIPQSAVRKLANSH
jgi:RHS repeat-associated protein